MKTTLIITFLLLLGACKNEQTQLQTLSRKEGIQTQETTEVRTKVKCTTITSDKKSFDKRLPELYATLLAASVDSQRVKLEGLEGHCNDFFEYLYSYQLELSKKDIYPEVFPVDPYEYETDLRKPREIQFQFSELDKDVPFKVESESFSRVVIINSVYSFGGDDGQVFFEFMNAIGGVHKLKFNSFNRKISYSQEEGVTAPSMEKTAMLLNTFRENVPALNLVTQIPNRIVINEIHFTSPGLNVLLCSLENYATKSNVRCSYALDPMDENAQAYLRCAQKLVMINSELIANLKSWDLRFDLNETCRLRN